MVHSGVKYDFLFQSGCFLLLTEKREKPLEQMITKPYKAREKGLAFGTISSGSGSESDTQTISKLIRSSTCNCHR